jgi:hypothetical protein
LLSVDKGRLREIAAGGSFHKQRLPGGDVQAVGRPVRRAEEVCLGDLACGRNEKSLMALRSADQRFERAVISISSTLMGLLNR